MGNAKFVRAKGQAPFTVGNNEETNRYLGYLNHPGSDLSLKWAENVKEYRDNSKGGRTAYYEFTIEGVDGRRHEFYTDIVNALKKGGAEFYYFQWKDLQNNTAFFDHLTYMVDNGLTR